MEVEYGKNTRGVAVGGLTTGIIGTALGVLNGAGGLLGGMRSGCGCGSGSPAVSQYELGMANELASKDASISLLQAEIYNNDKLLQVYKYFDGELKEIRNQLCTQAVVNTQITANISCIQQNLAVLNGLTKTVIPVDSICPTPAIATTTT